MKAEATHGRRKKSLKQQIHPEAIKKYKNIHGIVTGKGQLIGLQLAPMHVWFLMVIYMH